MVQKKIIAINDESADLDVDAFLADLEADSRDPLEALGQAALIAEVKKLQKALALKDATLALKDADLAQKEAVIKEQLAALRNLKTERDRLCKRVDHLIKISERSAGDLSRLMVAITAERVALFDLIGKQMDQLQVYIEGLREQGRLVSSKVLPLSALSSIVLDMVNACNGESRIPLMSDRDFAYIAIAPALMRPLVEPIVGDDLMALAKRLCDEISGFNQDDPKVRSAVGAVEQLLGVISGVALDVPDINGAINTCLQLMQLVKYLCEIKKSNCLFRDEFPDELVGLPDDYRLLATKMQANLTGYLQLDVSVLVQSVLVIPRGGFSFSYFCVQFVVLIEEISRQMGEKDAIEVEQEVEDDGLSVLGDDDGVDSPDRLDLDATYFDGLSVGSAMESDLGEELGRDGEVFGSAADRSDNKDDLGEELGRDGEVFELAADRSDNEDDLGEELGRDGEADLF